MGAKTTARNLGVMLKQKVEAKKKGARATHGASSILPRRVADMDEPASNVTIIRKLQPRLDALTVVTQDIARTNADVLREKARARQVKDETKGLGGVISECLCGQLSSQPESVSHG